MSNPGPWGEDRFCNAGKRRNTKGRNNAINFTNPPSVNEDYIEFDIDEDDDIELSRLIENEKLDVDDRKESEFDPFII